MESSSVDGSEGAVKNEKADNNEGDKALLSKVSDMKSPSNKDLFFRADKIDFKSWDIQLEKHLSRVWSREREVLPRKTEEWEIELAKLDIRHEIARGTYGTVYRGAYDGQDVAGIFAFSCLEFESV